jgi:hypothetical protein
MLKGFIPGMKKYAESEWSFAQVHGLESQTICAFGHEPGTIIVLGSDGSYHMCSFVEGGECEKKSFARFVRAQDEAGASDSVIAKSVTEPETRDMFHSLVVDDSTSRPASRNS